MAGTDDRYSSAGHLRGSVYDAEMERLQEQLVLLQYWIQTQGLKVLVIFEGRGSAGKGGVITRITERTSPRPVRIAALPKPTDRERTQWYFQRYVEHLPAAGEMVLLDRSWYNRSNVEWVMGFCTEAEHQEFLRSCPEFERMLVRSVIRLITPPLPAEPRPSKTTRTLSPCDWIQYCSSTSCSCSRSISVSYALPRRRPAEL